MTHDQNFKNLILDYPVQSLQFFAPSEAPRSEDEVVIKPLRQEQLKDRLSDRFFELDQWGERILDATSLDEVFRVH